MIADCCIAGSIASAPYVAKAARVASEDLTDCASYRLEWTGSSRVELAVRE
jgi:hypothetical protein